MTDEISVSFKVGQDLFNVKGSDAEAVKCQLNEFFLLGADFERDEVTAFQCFLEAKLVAAEGYTGAADHAKAEAAVERGLGGSKAPHRYEPAAEPAERTPTANGAGFTTPVVEQPNALLIASIVSAADEASLFSLARENKTVWSGDVRAAADKRLAELRAA